MPYRNYFVVEPQTTDFVIIKLLEADGMMANSRKPGFLPETDIVFHVTEKGKQFVYTNEPKLPSQTRSQRRYTAFLRADCSETFGEWLKNRYWDNYRTRHGV
jgi:hypothetical protein